MSGTSVKAYLAHEQSWHCIFVWYVVVTESSNGRVLGRAEQIHFRFWTDIGYIYIHKYGVGMHMHNRPPLPDIK